MIKTKTRIGWQIAGACLLIGCGSSGNKQSSAMAQTTPSQEQQSTEVAQDQTPPPTVTPSDVPASGEGSATGMGADKTESKTGAPVTGGSDVGMGNDSMANKQATPGGASGTTPTGAAPAGGAPGATPPAGGSPTAGAEGATHAEATVKMLGEDGAQVGTITFDQSGKSVTMKGTFTGLKPGKHGIHIHEKGDCGGKEAKNAGQHFNPTNAKHGPPESGTRHAGDFGNITADKEGNATFEMTTDSLTIAPGADSIANRAIIIHAKADNGKTQPSGASGAPIACGVIEVK
jgi:Cu-Zn family superoxide dismutase